MEILKHGTQQQGIEGGEVEVTVRETERNEMGLGPENVRMRLRQDRISSLPDEIIHHILSFNDTKYAVQSSVLSSRWKLVWTTLPYLKFSTNEFRILPPFSKFVNRVLSYRNNRTELSAIDLCFRGRLDQKFVHKIANYAVSHNVQTVSVIAWQHEPKEYKAKEDHQFPLCIFSSQSLKYLSLETHPYDYHIFPLPQSPWDSPALTTIKLTNVWLCDRNTTSLDLFSKCVSLMNLSLIQCHSVGLKVMKILCPRLVSLTISHWGASKYEILAPALTSFCFHGGDRDLTSFCLDDEDDEYPVILSTGGLNSLDKVYLDMFISTRSSEYNQREAHKLMNMLHQLRSAKYLTLKGNVIEFLSTALDLLEHQPSPFCNLKCLSIDVWKSAKTNQVISYLFNSSPTATVTEHDAALLGQSTIVVVSSSCPLVSEEMRQLQETNWQPWGLHEERMENMRQQRKERIRQEKMQRERIISSGYRSVSSGYRRRLPSSDVYTPI